MLVESWPRFGEPESFGLVRRPDPVCRSGAAVDADAPDALAEAGLERPAAWRAPTILTPHAGEWGACSVFLGRDRGTSPRGRARGGRALWRDCRAQGGRHARHEPGSGVSGSAAAGPGALGEMAGTGDVLSRARSLFPGPGPRADARHPALRSRRIVKRAARRRGAGRIRDRGRRDRVARAGSAPDERASRLKHMAELTVAERVRGVAMSIRGRSSASARSDAPPRRRCALRRSEGGRVWRRRTSCAARRSPRGDLAAVPTAAEAVALREVASATGCS